MNWLLSYIYRRISDILIKACRTLTKTNSINKQMKHIISEYKAIFTILKRIDYVFIIGNASPVD